MQKKVRFSILAVFLTLVVSVAVVASVPFAKPLLVEGVVINADGNHFELFGDLAQSEAFLISPQMHETAQPVDHLMFNGAASFLQVVKGNLKNPIHVLRVYSEENEFLYCLTFDDELLENKTLEKNACLEFLSPENGTVVLIEFPDKNLKQPVLEISSSKLVIKPKTDADIGETSFLALEIIFPNASEIIDKSNLVVDRISS